jgi:glycosyltransferase involved in cell wall biosynthesis
MNQTSIKKILYVRSAPYELNFDSYNLQEVGLGTAFCNRGFDFDIVYYSKENKNQVIAVGDREITILWRKGIKLLRTGIYPFILNKEFLDKYDYVIMSEYSQIMSYLVAKKYKNVYLYNGPYYNLFKLPFMEPFYDRLVSKSINSNVKKIFCKTQMAADFIARKGITNSIVVGVGLDISKFEAEKQIEKETQELIGKMEGKRNLLYVGSIISRKNTEFLIKSFIQLKKKSGCEDVQLVLVGKGDASYENQCKEIIPMGIEKDIVWFRFIKNAQLKFIYQKAYAFVLPSVQEIFGMVLLEAMYFGLPVVSSHNAGAGTLIQDRQNGLIIEKFDVTEWVNALYLLIEDKELALKYGTEAAKTIRENYMWDSICGMMLKFME